LGVAKALAVVKDALLQDDRETVSVYAFAPTKIANIAYY